MIVTSLTFGLVVGSVILQILMCRPRFLGSSMKTHGGAFLIGLGTILALRVIFSSSGIVEKSVADGGWYGWSMFAAGLLLLSLTLVHLLTFIKLQRG